MKVEAHFDESGTDASEITMAGYLFEASRVDQFCQRWLDVLKRYDVPYFHMVDCAHGAKPFDKLHNKERVKLQMELMRLIKESAINGIVYNIKNDRTNSGFSYFEAAIGAARVVSDWVEKTSYDGKIAYFFEAGANGAGQVDEWFSQMSSDPLKASAYRYAGHAFISKEGNPGVQAADLLAWQYHNFTKKRQANSLARLDLRALLRHPHHIEDRCGALPRDSHLQSVHESRKRCETVYYLPEATPHQVKNGSVLKVSSDFTLMRGDYVGEILCCPKCFRAVCEDVSIKQLVNIVIRCFCGTYCFSSGYIIPMDARRITAPIFQPML